MVREKTHPASPMTLDQALYEMELVGHDFYLFVDKESERPAVVYRRRGYDYGVISLDLGARTSPGVRSGACGAARLRGWDGPNGPSHSSVGPPGWAQARLGRAMMRRGRTDERGGRRAHPRARGRRPGALPARPDHAAGVESGIEVVGEAGDGVEGTTLADGTAPDVVLLDIRMPKRSGIEACLAIKEAVPSAKIIMLTVSDEEADLYEAVKSGASGYLLKDSSIEEVAQAVRVVADGQSLISPSMAVKLIDEFKQMSRPERDHVPGLRLTERELEVLRLVAKGMNNREIAKQLFISENTVKNHVRNILEKLQLHSRMEAVMYAVKEKLLDLP